MNCRPWPGSIRMEMALVISWHSENKVCQHGWWWGCHTWSHHDMSTVMRVCLPTALLRSESRPTTRKEKVPSARLLWYILQKRVRNIRKDKNFHYILIRLCLTIGDSGEIPKQQTVEKLLIEKNLIFLYHLRQESLLYYVSLLFYGSIF